MNFFPRHCVTLTITAIMATGCETVNLQPTYRATNLYPVHTDTPLPAQIAVEIVPNVFGNKNWRSYTSHPVDSSLPRIGLSRSQFEYYIVNAFTFSLSNAGYETAPAQFTNSLFWKSHYYIDRSNNRAFTYRPIFRDDVPFMHIRITRLQLHPEPGTARVILTVDTATTAGDGHSPPTRFTHSTIRSTVVDTTDADRISERVSDLISETISSIVNLIAYDPGIYYCIHGHAGQATLIDSLHQDHKKSFTLSMDDSPLNRHDQIQMKNKILLSTAVVIPQTGQPGTAVCIVSKNYLVTAYHVVGEHNDVALHYSRDAINGAQGSVIYRDPIRDIAILHIESEHSFFPIRIDLACPSIGDLIYAAGYSAGPTYGVSVIDGNIISCLDRLNVHDEKIIVHTAPIISGYSGRPLINSAGDLVGINLSRSTLPLADGTTEHFAMPMSQIYTDVYNEILSFSEKSK